MVRVIDGDTIDAHCDGEKVRVRLLRINTPEHEELGYEEAAAALRDLIGDSTLQLEFEVPGLPVADAFGRLLAYVRADGNMVNVEMVRLGWSPFWTRYGKGRFADAFQRAEREAQDASRGIWRAGVIAPPAPGARSRRGIADTCRPRSKCCRVCTRGAACGDSCISAGRSCHNGAGCACNAANVCAD